MSAATVAAPAFGVTPDGLLVEQVRCKPGNLSYVVASLPSGTAAIIDPEAAGAARYADVVARRGLSVAMVVDTHTHVDHVSIARDLAAEHGCPIVMHRSAQRPRVTRRVDDGERLALGDHAVVVWHCPGHTRDMLVLLVGRRAFTGDTLFVGSCGRSDLPGGDHRAQWASLQRLLTLPEDTVVYPGHDYCGETHTRIGAERATNPRLRLDQEAFVADALGRLDVPFPERFEEAIRANTR